MMRQFNLFKCAVLLMLLVCPLVSKAQLSDDDIRVRNRINEAVMGVYNSALDKDPSDYNTRFARANQLYYNGEYDKAIDDVKQVIAAIANKEKELRFDSYMLLATLYDQKAEYANEIEALRQAMALNPNSLPCVDMLAKVSYKVGDLNASEQNYAVILRDNPLSYDAMYGLAQIEVSRNNYEKAAEYVDRAVSLFTAEPQVYINRANVLMMMQQYEPAAQDLISALSVGADSGKALNALVDMSDTHYDAVMDALANSYDKAPRVGTFYYVRAMIAMRHMHYGQALRDLKSIIYNNLYDYHSIYYYAAQCQHELTQWDDALDNINKAIAMAPDEMDYYALKADIVQYRGRGSNYDAAIAVLDEALAKNSASVPVLMAKARLLLKQRKDKDALACVTAALSGNSSNAEALLLRGWINKYRLNSDAMALADFEKVASLSSDMYNLKGFALHELGRDDSAREWAKEIIEKGVLPGGNMYYYAAAVLSDLGDDEKGDNRQAMEYLRSALANGYGSLYEMNINEDPYINLKLLRRNPEFKTVIEQNQTNFQERR